MRAELDTSGYDTGVRISDRQMDVLPLTATTGTATGTTPCVPRRTAGQAVPPDPFDRPSAGLVWLCHPALTGLPAQGWDAWSPC